MHTFIAIGILFVQARCQFPNHIDLQKIDEITFKNEKHNVLKPTIHMVRDHFEDVMLQRRNTFPTNKLFMDRNGFRHFWKGLEVQPNSRKNTQHNATRTQRKQPNRKKKALEKVFLPNIRPKQLRDGSTLVKTTFFCPFFGVMTMLTDVNLDEEPKQE